MGCSLEKINKKRFIVFLFLILFLKSLLAPLNNQTIQSLLDGLRITDPVQVIFKNASKEEISRVVISRVRVNNDEEKVWLSWDNEATYTDRFHYIRELSFTIPVSLIQKGTVRIGKTIYKLSEFIPDDKNSVAKHNKLSSFTINSTNLSTKRSIIPVFNSLLNYKGDIYLLFGNILLTVFFFFVYILLKDKLSQCCDWYSISLFWMSFLVFKMLITHYDINLLFLIIIDLIIFLSSYCLYNSLSEIQYINSVNLDNKDINILAIGAIILLFIVQNQFYFFHRESTLDEGKYLIRGYWYLKNILQPYSKYDGNFYPPVYFVTIGFWQVMLERFFPLNLVIVRLFSVALIVLNVFLITKIIKRITKSIFWTIFAIFLYNLAPFAGVLYNYAHPIILVNTLLLLAFYGYLNLDRMVPVLNILFYSILYILLFFTRRNMILILPWVFIFQLVFTKKRFTVLVGTVIVSLLGIVLVFLLFPIKLLYNYANLPVIGKLLYKFDLLTREGVPGGTNIKYGNIPTWDMSTDPFWMRWRHKLWSYSNRYFLIFSMLNTFAVWLANTNNIVKKYAVASGTIFIASALLHAIGSPAPSNVFSYVHYTFSIGIIGATLGLKLTIDLFESKKNKEKLFTFILLVHVFFFFSRSVYRYYVAPYQAHHQQSIVQFSNELKKYSLSKENILVIDSYRYIAQMAVHYAGGNPEPATLNLPFAHSQPRFPSTPVPEEKYRERNRWSDEIMRRWIETEKNIVILYNDDKYATVWKPEMEKYFNNKELFYFPYIGWYTIYSR